MPKGVKGGKGKKLSGQNGQNVFFVNSIFFYFGTLNSKLF